MSQDAVQKVIGRAITDAEFRQRLIDSAREACAGYDLSEAELEALEALDQESMQAFAGKLDARLSKSAGKGFI